MLLILSNIQYIYIYIDYTHYRVYEYIQYIKHIISNNIHLINIY